MAKLKVGDKFKVKTDLIGRNIYGGLYFSKNMEKFRGNILTVKRVNTSGRYQTVESRIYVFNDSMIEAIDRKQSIHITTDGTITTAILKDGKQVVKRSETKCSPDDNFDFNIGAMVAFNRLMGVVGTTKPVESNREPHIREVKRKAKVGEWVMFTDKSRVDGNLFGKIGKVLAIHDGRIEIEHEKAWRSSPESKKGYEVTNFKSSVEYVVLENFSQENRIYTQSEVDELLNAERNRIYEEVARVFKGVGINGTEI